jgi:phytoene dehydrogenase-like protein
VNASATPSGDQRPVLIIGGGMAGLACAYRLVTAGVPVRLFEASKYLGGRVHTRMRDGLPIDDGFQVLFRAYPETRRLMDDVGFGAALIRPYDRGAICYDYGAPFTFSTNPKDLLTFRLMSLADKARLGALGASVLRTHIADIWADTRDEPTEAYLRRFGFSAESIERFFRPFFTGIFLNAALDTSSKNFRFVYKMLASGQTVTTRDGLGAIPQVIAAAVRKAGGVIEMEARATALIPSEGVTRITAIEIARPDGATDRVEGSAVVVAATPPEARRLLEPHDAPVARRIPTIGLPSTTLAWKLPRSLYPDKKILVNSDALAGTRRMETGFHLAMQITNATHPGRTEHGYLLVAASIAEACADEGYRREILPRAVLATLAKWFPHSGIEQGAELVDVHYTAFGQYAQPPGTRERLPSNRTRFPTLMLAGEVTESSSIEGAVVSGTRAAELIRTTLRADARMMIVGG